jgi:hypothetical protein
MKAATDQRTENRDVEIGIADVVLHGMLTIPDRARQS